MARIRPLFDARPMALGATLAVMALGALPAQAQQVITDNSSIYSNNPSVYVDLGVLDQLGKPATLQSLLSGREALETAYPQLALPSQKIKLKSPAKPRVAKAPVKIKPKPVVEILPEPETKLTASEPAPATPAPQTQVDKTPISPPAPPVPPSPPKIAEAAPAPMPIVKAVEPPKPPAPPAIDARQDMTPPSAPEIKRPTETASLPDAAAPSVMEGGESLLQIVFGEGATRIPDSKLPELKALANRMAKDEEIRLQLLAYAEGTDANASKARRLSLSRALSVRSYLIDQGVRSTRIDVRALGNKAGSGPSERVDIVMMKK